MCDTAADTERPAQKYSAANSCKKNTGYVTGHNHKDTSFTRATPAIARRAISVLNVRRRMSSAVVLGYQTKFKVIVWELLGEY